MTIQNVIYATALALSSALPAAANASCKVGAAMDGKSYRLCEFKNEVIVEEISETAKNYDASINALISQKRELDKQPFHPSIPSAYFGVTGSFGANRAIGSAGLTLGTSMMGGWRGEISIYPQSFWSRGKAALSTRETYHRMPASAFLGYTFATLGSTAFYAGTELAIAQSSLNIKSISTGQRHRADALIGIVLGINHVLYRNISVDMSYRSYIGAIENTFYQKVRLSMNLQFRNLDLDVRVNHFLMNILQLAELFLFCCWCGDQ